MGTKIHEQTLCDKLMIQANEGKEAWKVLLRHQIQ